MSDTAKRKYLTAKRKYLMVLYDEATWSQLDECRIVSVPADWRDDQIDGALAAFNEEDVPDLIVITRFRSFVED